MAALEARLAHLDSTDTGLAGISRTVGQNSLAAAFLWEGDFETAESLTEQIQAHARRDNLVRMTVSGRCTRALMLALTGRLRDAEEMATAALDLAGTVEIGELYPLKSALLAQAVVAMQSADDARASELLAVISQRSRRHGDRAPYLYPAVLTARLLDVGGRPEEALATLDAAKATWVDWVHPPLLTATILAEEASLSLRMGQDGVARAAYTELMDVPGKYPVVRAHQRLTEAHCSWRLATEVPA